MNGLDFLIDETIKMKPLKKEKIALINGTSTYCNSLNVFVGRQRSGKTFTALKEIIKVSCYDPNCHLLVYINESGEEDDDTFTTLKHLINVPIIIIKYSKAEEYLKKLIKYKQLYKQFLEYLDELPDDVVNDLFNVLHIKDFNREYLHTLILLEDATNSSILKNQNSYINDLMTRCAHIQSSFFVIVHFWKALSTNIKSNLSTIYIFGGYSRQQLNYITYQMNSGITSSEIWKMYSTLDKHDKLMIDQNLNITNILK